MTAATSHRTLSSELESIQEMSTQMYSQYDDADYYRYMTEMALAFVAKFKASAPLGIILDTSVRPNL